MGLGDPVQPGDDLLREAGVPGYSESEEGRGEEPFVQGQGSIRV